MQERSAQHLMGSLNQRTFAQAPIPDQRQPTTIGDRLFDGVFICRTGASRVLASQHTSVDEGIGNTDGVGGHVCYLTPVPLLEYNCTLIGIHIPIGQRQFRRTCTPRIRVSPSHFLPLSEEIGISYFESAMPSRRAIRTPRPMMR